MNVVFFVVFVNSGWLLFFFGVTMFRRLCIMKVCRFASFNCIFILYEFGFWCCSCFVSWYMCCWFLCVLFVRCRMLKILYMIVCVCLTRGKVLNVGIFELGVCVGGCVCDVVRLWGEVCDGCVCGWMMWVWWMWCVVDVMWWCVCVRWCECVYYLIELLLIDGWLIVVWVNSDVWGGFGMDRARARRGEVMWWWCVWEKCVVNNEWEFLNGWLRLRGWGWWWCWGEGFREDRVGGRRGDGTRACGARRCEFFVRFGWVCCGDWCFEWCFCCVWVSGWVRSFWGWCFWRWRCRWERRAVVWICRRR